MARYFKTPFANEGDKLEIPNDIQADGSVSFAQGYGYDYERDQATDPQAKDISRESFNGLLHDITDAIGDIQRSGVAKWSDEVVYSKGSLVWHNKSLYSSLLDSNKSQPPSASWTEIVTDENLIQEPGQDTNKVMSQKAVTDFVSESTPIGTIQAYIGETAPNDKWLLCRGQAFSAESYPNLAQLLPDLKIPDLRGVALRGLDSNRGFDPNRKLLSYQEDAMQNATGVLGNLVRVNAEEDSDAGVFKSHSLGISAPAGTGSQAKGATFDLSLVARTADETVMKNVAVNFIIKAR